MWRKLFLILELLSWAQDWVTLKVFDTYAALLFKRSDAVSPLANMNSQLRERVFHQDIAPSGTIHSSVATARGSRPSRAEKANMPMTNPKHTAETHRANVVGSVHGERAGPWWVYRSAAGTVFLPVLLSAVLLTDAFRALSAAVSPGQGRRRPLSSSCSSWPWSAASTHGLSSRSWRPTPSWKVSGHPQDGPSSPGPVGWKLPARSAHGEGQDWPYPFSDFSGSSGRERPA